MNCLFIINAKQRLSEMASIHEQLRKRSEDLGKQNAELHALLTWFNANPDLWRRDAALNGPTVEKVRQLGRHAQLYAIAARRKL